MSIVHIAGPEVQVGALLRQRCSWCGEILIDYDLDRIAVPEGQDPQPATWPFSELIEVDGVAAWVRPYTDGEALPPNACPRLNHETSAEAARLRADGIRQFATYLDEHPFPAPGPLSAVYARLARDRAERIEEEWTADVR